VGGLVVGGLLGDEACGMDVQGEKKKGFPVLMKRKVGAAVAACLPGDRPTCECDESETGSWKRTGPSLVTPAQSVKLRQQPVLCGDMKRGRISGAKARRFRFWFIRRY
jgi:hypothetical protein